MDTNAVHDASASTEYIHAGNPGVELINVDFPKGTHSGDIMLELGSAGEVLTRVELDIACFSEKLLNLHLLMMHVATRESDFERYVSEKEHSWGDSVEKVLEFDLLSGILESEVEELDNIMSTLQTEIVNAREIVSSCGHWGMEEKLYDSAESLKQSLEQISEIREQSAKFQRILLNFKGQENWKNDKRVDFLENDAFAAKIKMQTSEQQRHILRMLEKSLARELEFEKKVAESRQTEEEMKLKLHSSQQEVYFVENEVAFVWAKFFEAENAAEIVSGFSKEILVRLQIVQFNLNSSIKREGELNSKLQGCLEKVKAKDSALQELKISNTELRDKLIVANSEAFTLMEKVSCLEKQLKESEFQLLDAKATADRCYDLYSEIHVLKSVMADLKEKMSNAESRAEKAEAECKLLTDNNMELTEELDLLKSSTSEKINVLERDLREAEIERQHAVASNEANLEKQSMLYSEIGDMENVIKNLKSKVSKAETQADNAEEKCIILSETNSDLNEELTYLRSRIDCLETSLRQAERKKVATAKDISIRTKVITELVRQLGFERERLYKQIVSLTKNKIRVENFQNTNEKPHVNMSHDGKGNGNEFSISKHDFTAAACAEENKNEATEFSAAISDLDNELKHVLVGGTKMGPARSTSELETPRNIDPRQLNFKHFIVLMVISVITAFWFHHRNNQF